MSLQSEIVVPAFQDLGVVASGETPSAGEMADALEMTNNVLLQWGTEELMNPTPGHGVFSLNAGVFAYTMGPSGNWATTYKPIRVKAAVASYGTIVRGLECLPMDQYHRKVGNPFGETSLVPELLGFDNAATNINVQVHKTPNAGAVILVDYWSAQPFSAFSTLGDTVTLAQGLKPALRYAVAMALWPQFPRLQGVALQALAALAQNSKASVVAQNASALGISQGQQQQPAA